MAVRNGERASAFYLAAYSDDPEVKKSSETMAKEELGQVDILHRERRRAYRRDDRKQASEARSPAIDARSLELCLATHLAAL